MKKISLSVLSLFMALACALPALAWDDTGHQVVAAIAWSRLDKPVQDKVEMLFPADPKAKQHIIFTSSKKMPTAEEKYPKTVYNHVTIANWMDDLRDNSYDNPLKDWHQVNRPIFHEMEPKLVELKSPNVREKIIEMIQTLQKVKNFDKAGFDHAEDKSRAAYALATLIHLVGDVHQPLHCASRYTKLKPRGDAGGNGFLLAGPAPCTNLHEFWDAAGGLFDFVKLGREFDEAHQKQLDECVARVTARWKPDDHPDWRNYSPEEWVEESYQFAKQKVYQGVTASSVPDPTYTQMAQQLSAERLATAGYRLAEILNQIFAQP